MDNNKKTPAPEENPIVFNGEEKLTIAESIQEQIDSLNSENAKLAAKMEVNYADIKKLRKALKVLG